MRVVYITDKPDSPCGFWRVTRPVQALKDVGIDAEYCWVDSNLNPTVSIKDSIVILQRFMVYNIDYIEQLRLLEPLAILYEIDDDTLSNAYVGYLSECGRISPESFKQVQQERETQIELLQQVDGVTTTTQKLAALLESYTSKPIYVLPNSIDVDWFTDKLDQKPRNTYELSVGWAGGLRPESDLYEMAKAWGQIADKYAHIKFVVGGWQPDCIYREVPLERIERIPWATLEEWPKTMQVNIGCCTAPQNPFNDCKSPIKALEYGLAGAAVIATEGVYGKVISNYGNGLLVNNHRDAWYTALEYLIENGQQRVELAHNMKHYVKIACSLKQNIGLWLDTFDKVEYVSKNTRVSSYSRL